MRRREFITLFGGMAAWPLAASAQQPAMPVIGVLAGPSAGAIRNQIDAFNDGLKQAGFVEGQNLTIEYRWANGQYEKLPAMAVDLVGRQVAAILALAPAAALAAKAATATIPVVFVIGGDPVALGLVSSLNQPGGNVTGVNFLINALGGKRLDLIRELIPDVSEVALLVNPNNPGAELDRRDVEQVAARIGQRLHVVNAQSEDEFEAVFTALHKEGVGALIVSPDALFTSGRSKLVHLAAIQSLPTIFHLREAVLAGGLMSYGTSITEAHRIAGNYVARILKGAKPSELPVQQSTKFEFVINLKTAKSLGLNVPPTLLAIADEVIE